LVRHLNHHRWLAGLELVVELLLELQMELVVEL